MGVCFGSVPIKSTLFQFVLGMQELAERPFGKLCPAHSVTFHRFATSSKSSRNILKSREKAMLQEEKILVPPLGRTSDFFFCPDILHLSSCIRNTNCNDVI